jgi:hypothetical protein
MYISMHTHTHTHIGTPLIEHGLLLLERKVNVFTKVCVYVCVCVCVFS